MRGRVGRVWVHALLDSCDSYGVDGPVLLDRILVVLLPAAVELATHVLEVGAVVIEVLHVFDDLKVGLQLVRARPRANILATSSSRAIAADLPWCV